MAYHKILHSAFIKQINLFQNIITAFSFIAIVLLEVMSPAKSLSQTTTFFKDFSKEIKFTYLTKEQGLSNSSLQSILQDSRGYMWFGTENGLNSYDGYKFTVYKNTPDVESSLTNNIVNQLFEDSKKQLWVGTNYGFNIYNYRQNIFSQHLILLNDSNRIEGNSIKNFFEDHNGQIWIATGYGINLFDNNTQKLTHFSHNSKNNFNVNSDIISCFYEDKQQQLWIATDGNGIEVFSKNTGFKTLNNTLGNLTASKHMRISTIKSDSSGKIWVGTIGNGILVYDPTKNTIENYINDHSNSSSLSSNIIKNIMCDHAGNVWIATENGGINIWQPANKTFTHYQNDPKDPSSFSQQTASSIFEDNQKNIWIGTFKGGINLYCPNAYKFKNYTQGNLPGTLSYKDVKAFYEDDDGTIWIGTDGGGINVWDRKKNVFKQFRFNQNDKTSIGSDAILQIIKDHNGTIWVGTWGGGLNKYDRATKKFTRFLNNPKDSNSISSNNAWRIYEDKQGKLWIGTFYGGLNIFDPVTSKFSKIETAPDGQSHFLGNNVTAISPDSIGNLWFGTEDGRVNFLDIKTQKFINYFFDSYTPIRCIYKDKKNRIWVGTTGLYVFDPTKKKFNLYSTNPFLSKENIFSINEDRENNFWMGTGDGLIKLNPETKLLYRFTEADGLQGPEFSPLATLTTAPGEMLFGGFKGFNIFTPESIKTNKYLYPLYITDFQVFNKSITPENAPNALKEDVSVAKTITLNYNQSVFSIEYAALNYVSTKTEYAYLLDGFDKNWNYVGHQRKATYTNLNPGTYTFHVKASDANGTWNTPSTSITIIITPPFWLTWWFKTLVTIAIIATLFIILYYRRKAELKIFLEKQREELHQLQLQFFTNISHEFRTPLTLIIGTLEQIIKKDAESVFQRQYHTISRNANRLLHLISELMDFRKIETGALNLRVMPGDFGLFVVEIVKDFYYAASAGNIDLSLKQHANLAEKWFDRQIVEKMILNLLNNSFKYTPNNGTITIEIASSLNDFSFPYHNSFTIENDYQGKEYMYISITDSGIGISKESITHLFERYYRVNDAHMGSGIGLAFVKNLALFHKASIQIYSEKDRGSQFIICLPCHHLDYTKEENWLEHKPNNDGTIQLESIQNNLIPQTLELDKITTTLKQSNDEPSEYFILIVEDNHEVRLFLKETLAPHYKIIEAENGKIGLIKAKEQSPALIISDVMMPIMDGLEFCNLIKKDIETSHIPFILLSAKDAIEAKIQGLDFGADYYFSKPINTDLLLKTIKNIFEQRRIIRERYTQDYQIEAREMVHNEQDKSFMDNLLKLIDQNLENPELDVDIICQKMGMSKTKLYSKIKNITGQSITEFVRKIRLKKAIDIMTHEDMLITEIMFRVGILSQSYFTTIFKKEFGMTPSHFQQQLRKKKE
ncbi:MAG: response regulator [Pedobacter sp.]|nr:response regulator [Chitinophagaceae bacterium]